MTARRLTSALVVVGVALSGCANDPRLGEARQPMVVTKLTELPPPTGTDPVTNAVPYHVSPLDKLSVVVAGVPELTGKFQTDTAGQFLLPYIGAVDAAGHTPTELAATIDQRLRGKFVNDPHVAVNIDEADSLVVNVDGQVTQPGAYTVTGNMSLMRAISAAKGLAEYARMDDVVVFRTVDGKPMAALYNISAIRQGLYPDPKIYANDVVVVGDSKARRGFQQFLQVVPLLTTPLILTLERIR